MWIWTSPRWQRLVLLPVLLQVLPLAVLPAEPPQDFYQLLGVDRAASGREVRRAFKKLALTTHPDKNPNDASAHDKFLRITRAYEVLKDQDLRKKYDKYGEKGLDQQQGGRYESWNYYRYDFGIYDDDLEVITLDRGDFEAAVNSGEIWFINFYFPRCSHCHQLAPTWRDLAKEVDGLLRVGAVNCGDDGSLCRSKGVNSYPSLYVYRAGRKAEKYFGDRSKDSLLQFAMQFVTTTETELWPGNVFGEIERAFSSSLGWLITFCSDTGDCLESKTRHKLAGMLDGLVKVGWMDCTSHKELCESFQVTSGSTALFPPGSSLTQHGSVLWFQTLDSKEVYNQVLSFLPELELLDQHTFQEKLARHRWLVSFTFGPNNMAANEYKKLQALLRNDNIQVGRVNCLTDSELCDSLYIHKTCLAAFKGFGVNDFEIHHGKEVLYSIVAFARDSVAAHVTSLQPENFPSDRKEPWLVDFFAPWCPPCRALLPELRKASIQLAGQIRFGTLDCTVHQQLCSTYNIQAYPTTVIFNRSSLHEYEGQHSAAAILDFIQDLVNPSVVELDPVLFTEKVKGRSAQQVWAVDFYAPWCGPCQALLPQWRRMARLVLDLVLVGSVDCEQHQSFCRREGVRAYPELRLYSHNPQRPDAFTTYSGWHRDAQSLRLWILSALPRVSVDLGPDSFRSLVLSASDHWLLDFYAPWCRPCHYFAPEFEVVARVLEGVVRAGKLDCHAHPQACQSAGVTAYPSVRFYPKHSTSMGGEHVDSRDAGVIARTLRQRLQQLQRLHKERKDEL